MDGVPGDAAGLEITVAHDERAVDAEALRERIETVVAGEDATLRACSVVLADHELVLQLNREHLEHDYLTDVLSFPLNDPEETGVVDGEIYVDLDTAAERHEEFGVSFEDEVHRYVIHGLLHLLGYDDHTERERDEMRQLEDRYLAA